MMATIQDYIATHLHIALTNVNTAAYDASGLQEYLTRAFVGNFL